MAGAGVASAASFSADASATAGGEGQDEGGRARVRDRRRESGGRPAAKLVELDRRSILTGAGGAVAGIDIRQLAVRVDGRALRGARYE